MIDQKIIFVIGSLQIGGTEKHLLQIAPQLKNKGFSPMIYSLAGDGPLKSFFEQASIPVIDGSRIGRFFYWLPPKLKGIVIQFCNVLQLSYFLLQNRSAILHAFLPSACIISGIATFLVRHKIFLSSRRSLNYYQKKYRFRSAIERWAMRRCNKVLGNSEAILNNLKQENIPEAKLKLIYNGIDFSVFNDSQPSSEIRKRENIETGVIVLLIVANLIPYKGHIDLFNALNANKHKLNHKPWLLLCAGEGEHYKHTLQHYVRTLGLENNVRFLGLREDIARLWKLADVGLLVSHEEGFSNSLLEGMASGVPMIATEVGGNLEAIIHNKTGILVPPKEPTILGEKIVELISNKTLREQLGNEARLRIQERFSLDNTVENYVQLYKTVG